MDFEVYRHFSNDSALKIIGDVNKVLNGNVDEANLQSHVLEQLRFALGAGTFGDCCNVGETIVLNHVGFSTHVDKDKHLVTETGVTALRSPFLMGLGKDCKPSTLFEIKSEKGITLNKLFNDLGKELSAYAFVGSLLFDPISCSYLKKPPMFQESINENSDKYWAKMEEYRQCYAYVFGVVVKEQGVKCFSKEKLGTAFYVNPLEKNRGEILSHTHGALVKEFLHFPMLKKEPLFYEAFDPNLIIGARHIFTQSIVKNGLFALFNISAIE